MALEAALPAWNGFVIDPKLDTNPLAILAAIAKAVLVVLESNFLILAIVAAAPTVPMTPVGCQPLMWY